MVKRINFYEIRDGKAEGKIRKMRMIRGQGKDGKENKI